MTPPLALLILSTTWYVSGLPDGGRGRDGGAGSSSDPFGTIQEGLDRAGAGDTVVVRAGLYFENLDATKHQVTLVAEDAGTAIVDGSKDPAADSPCLRITGQDWVVRGMTFQNGKHLNVSILGSLNGNCFDGGLELDDIRTGGFAKPSTPLCSTGVGDTSSYDVRVNCLPRRVWIHRSRFAAEACSASLYLIQVPALVAEDNEVSGAHRRPIWLVDGMAGGELRGNWVHGPCCDGKIMGRTEVTSGIRLEGNTSRIHIHHNVIEDTGDYGISILDNADRLSNEGHLVHNNTMVGLRECGIEIDAASVNAHSNLVSRIGCSAGTCQNLCRAPCGVVVLNTQSADSGMQVQVGYDLVEGARPAEADAGIAYCIQAGLSVVQRGPVVDGGADFLVGANGDYRLAPSSPAIEAGDPLVEGGVDFEGKPFPADSDGDGDAGAEIGAIEFFGPVASISPRDQQVDPRQMFELDGRGSRAPVGATLDTFTWEAVEGPTGVTLGTREQQMLSLTEPGKYVFALVVTDSEDRQSPPSRATVRVAGEVFHPDAKLRACGCGAVSAPILVLALAATLRRRDQGRRS